MGQNNSGSPEADGFEAERHKIEEIQTLLKAFDMLEGSFASLATAAELRSAEGRRCILSIRGLQYHKADFFFEVVDAGIHQVQPFEKFNTYIAAPIDSVTRVLKGMLEGDEHAFTKEWARGQAKLVGDYSVHDGLQFDLACRRFARLLNRYRALTAS